MNLAPAKYRSKGLFSNLKALRRVLINIGFKERAFKKN
jgi:hypothetical protein